MTPVQAGVMTETIHAFILEVIFHVPCLHEFRVRLCQTVFLTLRLDQIILKTNVISSYVASQMLEINLDRSYFANRSGTTTALYKNE